MLIELKKEGQITMSEITITKKIQITDEDIDNIMITALEGGITYWAVKVIACNETGNKREQFLGEYASEQISKGGYLKIILDEPFETDEKETNIWGYVLSKGKLLTGLTKAITENSYTPDTDEEGRINLSDIDACIADTIIQYALFGKEIFG